MTKIAEDFEAIRNGMLRLEGKVTPVITLAPEDYAKALSSWPKVNNGPRLKTKAEAEIQEAQKHTAKLRALAVHLRQEWLRATKRPLHLGNFDTWSDANQRLWLAVAEKAYKVITAMELGL